LSVPKILKLPPLSTSIFEELNSATGKVGGVEEVFGSKVVVAFFVFSIDAGGVDFGFYCGLGQVFAVVGDVA
jgi:hypothetical protein